MNKSSSTKLTELVSTLGGPGIADTDIEWALDLPAGKKLVEWLAAQLCDEEGDIDKTIFGDGETKYGASLRAIALEAGEIDILKHIGTVEDTYAGEIEGVPSGYLPPSRLKKHAEHMNNETRLWDEEAVLLKSRLQQTKLASQKIAQTMKSLQTAIEREDLEIAQRQDRLAELSLHGDTTIFSTVKGAQTLLDVIGCYSEPGPATQDSDRTDSNAVPELASAVASLSNLSSLRSSIIDFQAFQREQINEACLRILSPDVIKADAGQLQAAHTHQLGESAAQAAFLQHLSDACKTLETAAAESDALEKILDGDVQSNLGLGHGLDIPDELEKAWSLDQAAILGAQGKLLDTTISTYRNDLIGPLTVLQQSLSTLDKQVRDSEALIGALAVELEEVVDDVRCAKENSDLAATIPSQNAFELEAKLLGLLKDLKDLRPVNAPPLVLLHKEDIIDELRSLSHRVQSLQEQETAWSAGMSKALSTMASMHLPFLSKVYEHSPVNTSPPFSLPPDIAQLQKAAKDKGDDLGVNVGRLQTDLETLTESSRTKRKLGAFTDKWHKETRRPVAVSIGII